MENNNNIGMRSILTTKENPAKLYGQLVKKAFSHDWIFGSAWEKLIIFLCFAWGVYSLGRFLWYLI